ncbi:MAG: ABC transporter ATP-binding protein [Chlorobi bacterium]|nr:ABC transporter ATP-binding protein [Chlorobiota bacterium]
MSKALIKVEKLVKKFGETEILHGLTVDFNEGDRIALIGQNGAGKTTLIRCILGLYTYEGYLEVLGHNPRNERTEILKHVGFVPQLPPPIRMKVSELMNFFSEIFGVDKQVYIDLTNKLNLDVQQHIDKPFLKLSGGMKQKLLVSLALGHNPQILLMDEPAANLDPAARVILFDMLKNYREDALMLISSHRTDEIEHLINRVIEMDLGHIVVDKPFEAVKHEENC